MAMVYTEPRRVCDICGADITEGTAYQMSVPAVLTDNDGTKYEAADSSQTDVCPTCAKERAADVVGALLTKTGTITKVV